MGSLSVCTGRISTTPLLVYVGVRDQDDKRSLVFEFLQPNLALSLMFGSDISGRDCT